MLYCHDTFGLGHLRRTLALAHHLREAWPATSQLIVTGSPVAQGFPFPDGADYIKLPSVVKVGAGEYRSRSLATSFGRIRDIRQEMLLSAARHFGPDALIVDHTPSGVGGEVIPTLRYLKAVSPGTLLVLGLRDVVDEGPRVRQAWARDGAYELLDDVYDLILVYGSAAVYDVVTEYGLSDRAAAKTRYVGYLGRQSRLRPAAEVRGALGLARERLIVAAAGGGGDGYDLLRVVIEATRRREATVDSHWMVVTGPLMAAADRERLVALAQDTPAVRVVDFVPDLESYLGAADVVVAMGGYNTVCELLSLGRPTIIVPRVAPRKEQLIRAAALHARGLVRMIHPAELSPGRLLAAIDDLLTGPRRLALRLGSDVPLDGLAGVRAVLEVQLARRPLAAASRSLEMTSAAPRLAGPGD